MSRARPSLSIPLLSIPLLLTLATLGLVSVPPASSQQENEEPAVTVVDVADGVWMLQGRGGNIGVSAGDDGIVLIDDQYAPLTGAILTAVAGLGEGPVRFVINTHWHGDHTGGNENLGTAGAVIVAHDNVRVRMSSEQVMRALDRTIPPSPEAALPVVTFNDSVTFHLNGEELNAFHVGPAHTDGDAVIHFRETDVIHAGDIVFAGMYPFIDLSSGGSVDGLIAAVEEILELAGPDTRVIPGHGPVTDAAGLERYRDMLVAVRDAVATLVAEGRSVDEVVAAAPTSAYDAEWGGGFMSPERFIGIIYESVAASE